MLKIATFCPSSSLLVVRSTCPSPHRVVIFTLTVTSCGAFDVSSNLSDSVFLFFCKMNIPSLAPKQHCQVWMKQWNVKVIFPTIKCYRRVMASVILAITTPAPASCLRAWACSRPISSPKTMLKKYLLDEQMTVFSIFRFSNSHHFGEFTIYPVSIASTPFRLFLWPPTSFLLFQPMTSSTAL